MCCVFGTLYPLALEQLTGEKITVGAPFFNLTCGVLLLTSAPPSTTFAALSSAMTGRRRDKSKNP
jgi:cytochrome c biogenesis factor